MNHRNPESPSTKRSERTERREKIETVAAVEKAFAILELLGGRRDVSVSEISRQLELSKTTVHRLPQTLKGLGYVGQDGVSDRYRSTVKLFELGGKALENIDLVREADEQMRLLGELTRETVHLGVQDEDSFIYIHKIDSDYGLRMQSRIGGRKPLHCTAIGKVLLAYQPNERARTILENADLKHVTAKSITSVPVLMELLQRVRQFGVAEDNEEAEVGLRCIAVPVFDRLAHAVAALSISFPTMRCTDDTPMYYVSLLKAASEHISRKIGFDGRFR